MSSTTLALANDIKKVGPCHWKWHHCTSTKDGEKGPFRGSGVGVDIIGAASFSGVNSGVKLGVRLKGLKCRSLVIDTIAPVENYKLSLD